MGTSRKRHGRKIPVWRPVRDCYALTWARLPGHILQNWYWVAPAVLFSALVSWLTWSHTERLRTVDERDAEAVACLSSWDVWMSLLDMLGNVLPLAFVVPFFVQWHRALILDAADRVQMPTKVYMAYGFATVCLVGPIFLMIVIGIPALVTGEGWWSYELIGLLLFVAALALVIPRLYVRLAAIAVGRSDLGWHQIWRAGRGNTWRLLLCDAMLSVPVSLPLIVFYWIHEPTSQIGSVAYNVADWTVTILSLILEMTLASVVFLRFFANDKPLSIAAD